MCNNINTEVNVVMKNENSNSPSSFKVSQKPNKVRIMFK